ncbi:hypothetical protein PIB30_006944 [Stylosanthes scabra]|uniref:Isopenicillin N synthase-like Fe(2+) 2OG dioxygenase domain-containing protein n=1 Tax=Stylosanthes scabra TaxID=79078 RepID=A0ABU6Y639_9FABA|nr:hypothetical protein [Stylosanthes scabra]
MRVLEHCIEGFGTSLLNNTRCNGGEAFWDEVEGFIMRWVNLRLHWYLWSWRVVCDFEEGEEVSIFKLIEMVEVVGFAVVKREEFVDNDGETVEAYGQAISELATSISQKMAESLGIIEGIDFKDWPLFFRIIKYSFSAENIGSPGIKMHTDTGFMTLLQDDDKVEGLEVKDHSTGTFKTVLPHPGSFLCLIGDVGRVSIISILFGLAKNK